MKYSISIFYKFIFIIIIIPLIINNIIKSRKLLVCICTVAKKENKYIREFVSHYKNYGVDKIFLYDNNDFGDENFYDVLSDYIGNNFVKVIDYKGVKRPQLSSYKDCYRKHYRKYNWLIFYDVDEFIFLRGYRNIKDFLNQNQFNKCQRIQLNWIFHTDSNLLYYENKSMAERFPYREKKARGVKIGGYQGIKSMIRGNIHIDIEDAHILSRKVQSCDGFGNFKDIENIVTNVSDFYYYYIDHYYCKSTEEFINKILKSDVHHQVDDNLKLLKLEVYFSINEITKEKLDYIEKETKLNLSKFRNKIKDI